MSASVARLSAFPNFLRSSRFWRGVFDPRARLNPDRLHQNLLMMTASHRWDLFCESRTEPPTETAIALIDIAQGILERAAWAPCSWRVEQALAARFNLELGWCLNALPEHTGELGYTQQGDFVADAAFQNALVTARWQCEASSCDADTIWTSVPQELRGSEAERHFFSEILVPALGFPLLDFVRLQPTFAELGLDPAEFFDNRVDFALDTGRGVRLVIEIDGSQHADEVANDASRDEALRVAGWDVWRVPTVQLKTVEQLKAALRQRLATPEGKPGWGQVQNISQPRRGELLSCIWGATVVARIQFLILEALRAGALPWGEPWAISLFEHDTDVGDLALEDLRDWFGRLRRLHGEADSPPIMRETDAPALSIDTSVIQPHASSTARRGNAWASSRPAQCDGGQFSRKFRLRLASKSRPVADLITGFLRDIFRKRSLRDGQFEIIARILMGKDAVGLLPTGAGKSLTYQLSGLLTGGLTIYVSPLRSLIQDQYERLSEIGVDVAAVLMGGTSIQDNCGGLDEPGTRFILLTPERFLIEGFRNDLANYRGMGGYISQVVIDECHCVSEWGHEFRPAYLSLSRIARDRTRRLDVSAPLVALTGTASSIVLSDVMRELGIHDPDAVVRAKKLDRPEIEMICLSTKQTDKSSTMVKLIREFYVSSPGPREGLLIFCPFVGGGDGVMGAAAAISEVLPDDAYRIYTGKEPEWQKYAAVKKRRRAASLSSAEVKSCRPSWADGAEPWDQKKERWQREYISGTKNSFRVMIATKAFGMGIDKPSIREVIHWTSPASPESYYQEVGRACRDGGNGRAIMLFSDEYAQVANQILDPASDLDDVREVYREFLETDRFRGGDFIRTFFFHDDTFAGKHEDVDDLRSSFAALRDFSGVERPVFRWRSEKEDKRREYSVIRLILLGVITDYTKDYRLRTLELHVNDEWLSVRDDADRLGSYYALQFREYAQRYQISPRIEGLERILEAGTVCEADDAAARAIVGYVYSQIERKRRQATRKMLELARVGAADPEIFRRDLLLYLQVSLRYTTAIEEIAKHRTVSGWEPLVEAIGQRDDLLELHGACQRVLESYPSHPGLLLLSCITRLENSDNALDRSVEEFDAALKFGAEIAGLDEVKGAADFAVVFSAQLGGRICDSLESRFGVWLIEHAYEEEGISRFGKHGMVVRLWLSNVAREITSMLPIVGVL